MYYLLAILSILLTTTVGIIGFSQIFSALTLRSERGNKQTMLTILIWVILFTLYVAATLLHFPNYQKPVFIALGVSFLLSLSRLKRK